MTDRKKPAPAECAETDGDSQVVGRPPEEPAAKEGESLLPPGSAAARPDRAPERPSGTSAA